MAIVGKHNVLELVRMQKAMYWRVYENNNKRSSGNFIDSADFSDSSADLDTSVENLRRCLDKLSTGTYVLVAFTSKDKSKGGIDTLIEIEGLSRNMAGIGSTGTAAPEFYVEGIGKVTGENFESAIEKKFELMEAKLKKERELSDLKAENERLKKEQRLNETGYNKGVMTIGSVLYGVMSQTTQGKEFIGMASKAMFGLKKQSSSTTTEDIIDEDSEEYIAGKAAVNGTDDTTDNDERMIKALEKLSRNNPEILTQLEKLADLKDKDPEMFQSAVGSLDEL